MGRAQVYVQVSAVSGIARPEVQDSSPEVLHGPSVAGRAHQIPAVVEQVRGDGRTKGEFFGRRLACGQKPTLGPVLDDRVGSTGSVCQRSNSHRFSDRRCAWTRCLAAAWARSFAGPLGP